MLSSSAGAMVFIVCLIGEGFSGRYSYDPMGTCISGASAISICVDCVVRYVDSWTGGSSDISNGRDNSTMARRSGNIWEARFGLDRPVENIGTVPLDLTAQTAQSKTIIARSRVH